ncbi:MAG: hypothetical protein ACK4OO_06645, partial [bacterium]
MKAIRTFKFVFSLSIIIGISYGGERTFRPTKEPLNDISYTPFFPESLQIGHLNITNSLGTYILSWEPALWRHPVTSFHLTGYCIWK